MKPSTVMLGCEAWKVSPTLNRCTDRRTYICNIYIYIYRFAQIRAKIYSTRNNAYEIEYNEARIRLHLLNVVKLVKEDRKSARTANNLVEELENVIESYVQEKCNRNHCPF